ncbi:MAG: flagellar biosynthetic protein FliR [Gemmatimonadetes bacterium]|nr:flagellar biosynthetic protein FliR [Gemmatimonadota bacterium]
MNPGFDLLAPGTPDALVLLLLRTSGVLMLAPAFSATGMPRLVKLGILVVLTLLVAQAAVGAAHGTARLTPGTALAETLVGMAIGIGAGLLVAAAETAGDVLSIQIGLNGSALVDPLDGAPVGPLGVFMRLFVVTLLLTFNLHQVIIGALADSVEVVRLGSPLNLSAGALAIAESAGTLFALGVKMAAPVMGTVLVANVALAVAGRAAPQLNLLTLAFPVQIALGLGSLAAALPIIARWLSGWSAMYEGTLITTTRALGAVAH